MRLIFSEEHIDNVKQLNENVDDNSKIIDKIVDEIIQPYCSELDDYVTFIKSILTSDNPPTNQELDDFCMNLPTLIYFAGEMCEKLGIREDISKALYKETYHTARNSQDKGTVADKNSFAELSSQHEQMVNICYSRAYHIMKAKIESAQELLGSIKKVVSRRLAEFELTRIGK